MEFDRYKRGWAIDMEIDSLNSADRMLKGRGVSCRVDAYGMGRFDLSEGMIRVLRDYIAQEISRLELEFDKL